MLLKNDYLKLIEFYFPLAQLFISTELIIVQVFGTFVEQNLL